MEYLVMSTTLDWIPHIDSIFLHIPVNKTIFDTGLVTGFDGIACSRRTSGNSIIQDNYHMMY